MYSTIDLPSFETCVAGLSYIEGQLSPTISDDTSSLFTEKRICSTNSESKAALWIKLLIPSKVVSFSIVKFNMANEPLGVGTRIALDVNLFSNYGIALVTAFPAPVSVITIFKAAARPLRYLLCILSTRFWSLV